jgi:hypothetical protein
MGLDVESQATIDEAIAKLKAVGDEWIDRLLAGGDTLLAKAKDDVSEIVNTATKSMEDLLADADQKIGARIDGLNGWGVKLMKPEPPPPPAT